jgi:hypothetical protein
MLASICGHFDNRLIPCLLLSFVALGTWCLVGVKLPSIARMLACFYRLMLRWSLRCYSLRSPDRMRSCFYPWAPGCLVASTLASTLASMLTSSLGLASTPLAVTRLISRGLRSLGAWIVRFFSNQDADWGVPPFDEARFDACGCFSLASSLASTLRRFWFRCSLRFLFYLLRGV